MLNSDDLNNNEVKIKNNKTKEEEVISLDVLIYYLDEMINTTCDDECDCGCQDGEECTCGDDCHCGESCDCGCQDGKECTCGDDCHCHSKE